MTTQNKEHKCTKNPFYCWRVVCHVPNRCRHNEDFMKKQDDALILMAESMARRLTYNDPIQGAAKHVIYELCRRIEQKEKKSKSIIRWLSDTVLRASKK